MFLLVMFDSTIDSVITISSSILFSPCASNADSLLTFPLARPLP